MTYAEHKAAAVDAGHCTYPGCMEPPGETDLCTKHQADAKKRKARSYARNKAKRKAGKLCMRCGRKRKPGSRWCVACLISYGRMIFRDRDKQRDKDARIEGDGYARERFRGQGKRGPQPKHQLDDQDLEAAVKELQRARAALQYAASEEVQALPRAQRQEAVAKAVALAIYGIRLAAQVPGRHDVQIPDLSVVDED